MTKWTLQPGFSAENRRTEQFPAKRLAGYGCWQLVEKTMEGFFNDLLVELVGSRLRHVNDA